MLKVIKIDFLKFEFDTFRYAYPMKRQSQFMVI